MPARPSPADILRARRLGVCPWCGFPTEGAESDLCPECGNNARAALGPPDPGTPRRAGLGLLLALFLIVVVAVVQQLGGSALATGPGAPVAIEPPSAQFELTARLFAKFQRAFPDPQLGRSAVQALDDQASGPEDELRAAILAADLIGADDAVARLDKLEGTLKPESPLIEDIGALRAIYAGERPDEATGQRLKAHHGWFGELAAAYGLPDTSPERERLLGGGWALFIMMVLVGVVVFGAFIAGLVLLIIAMVQGTSGRLRPAFIPPTPGGSLAIEMVAVFALGFLILKGAISLAEGYLSRAAEAIWFGLIAQWALLAVVLWPRFVGAPQGRGMTLMGWHKGQGVLKEIGCGVVGYLACLPLLFLGAVISITLMLIYTAIRQAITGVQPPPPTNPILDIVSGKAGLLVVIMIYLLAALWAPIVEETIFRGCMYRHMRSRWHWLPAGLFTALCFGVMHAYPILMMGPVIALGFGFAMIREWRGSIIASMTAHCIHNAAVLGLLLVAMRLLG